MPKGRLSYYACGYTTHQMKQLMRSQPRERRTFPAGVFLYQHPDGRNVLFDTGYAPATWRAGVKGFLYNLLLPVRLVKKQNIAAQLSSDGISVDSITYVVLSHLHPDHIGGVRYFPQATFVLSTPMLATLSHAGLKEGFLPGLLPKWFNAAQKLLVNPELSEFDLLGDGSYRLVSLPGHAQGHMGALVAECVLLAGDASWGEDLMGEVPRMKAVPKAITHNWVEYQETIQRLQRMKDNGIQLYFSHDSQDRKELFS